MVYEQAPEDDEEYGPPLLMERLRRLGPLVVLLVALLAVTVATGFALPTGFLRPFVFIVVLIVVTAIVFISRRRDDREYGPGADEDV